VADEDQGAVLFPEPQVPRTGALGYVEPAVHWLTSITRPEAVAERAILNQWYADFPDPDHRLGQRLKSEDNTEHHGAVAEL
jgi:hypothetical protein